MSVSIEAISNLDKTQLIIDLLAKNFDTHLNIVWASNALLLGAIGWIITSKEARAFLSTSRMTNVGAQWTIALVAFIHYYLLWVTFKNSSDLFSLIKSKVQFIGEDLFFYNIPGKVVLLRASVTLVLFLFLFFLVRSARTENTHAFT